MNRRILDKLVERARSSQAQPRRYSHWTYIVEGSYIYAEGVNDMVKTHPMAARFGYPYARIHSEWAALKLFFKNYSSHCLRRCIVVNVRLGAGGDLLMAKPCLNCQRLLLYFGVKCLYYSTAEGFVKL